MYALGHRACPIRLATCIGFDNELYQKLLDGWFAPESVPKKRKAKSSRTRQSKRKAKATDELEWTIVEQEDNRFVPESEDEMADHEVEVS